MILGFIPWVDFGVISAEVADAGTHWGTVFTWVIVLDISIS